MIMQQSYLLIVIITIILFNFVSCDTPQEQACTNRSNTDCRTCVTGPSCGYCPNTSQCFLYDVKNALSAPCDMSQIKWGTCVGNFRVWIIIVAVLGGIIVLAVLIFICCLCRKCHKCKVRKIERREQRDDQRMEERRAAAEVRTAERNRVSDQIRMKYGILKEKDNNTDYNRME